MNFTIIFLINNNTLLFIKAFLQQVIQQASNSCLSKKSYLIFIRFLAKQIRFITMIFVHLPWEY